MVRIMLDPGHGGSDPGAVGPGGVREKDLNLAVAQQVAQYLKSVVEVRLTRWEDRSLGKDEVSDLAARVAAAEEWPADYFIAVHCNSADAAARGAETYALAPGGQGERLAAAIQSRLVAETGLSDRGVRFARFYVLRKTSMPAVLVELGFLSNPAEERLLADPAFQRRAARALAGGVATFLGLTLPPVAGYPVVPVVVRGKTLQGVIINDRTFVWIDDIARAYGDSVRWDAAARRVYVES